MELNEVLMAVTTGKDAAASIAAVPLINMLIQEKGFSDVVRINKLSIDSVEKTIEGELLLKGNAAPVSVAILGYSFRPSDADPNEIDLRWHSIQASLSWVQSLANLFAGKAIRIPGGVGKVLRLLM